MTQASGSSSVLPGAHRGLGGQTSFGGGGCLRYTAREFGDSLCAPVFVWIFFSGISGSG